MALRDYAGAWHAKRGLCHRVVYTSDDDGRPTECPEPVVATGWRHDWLGAWSVVDACARHAGEPGARATWGELSGALSQGRDC